MGPGAEEDDLRGDVSILKGRDWLGRTVVGGQSRRCRTPLSDGMGGGAGQEPNGEVAHVCHAE